MDPKVLCLLPGLVAPQHHGSTMPMPAIHALTAPATPLYEWPVRREPLEGDHPGHGEGSDESEMFVGINSNLSNTASVTVDSSASGVGPYTSVGWLPRGLNLVTSFDQFFIGERVPTPLPFATNLNVSPNATRHMNNPSTIKTRRSFTRRG
ncbi:MAG TPA: hypothetical protein VN946_16390 [Terriglobales bacterium]|nr:hypothetical protein [Terriglobales bacterium]